MRRLYGFAEHASALATDQVISVPSDEMQFARALGIPERKLAVVEYGIRLRSANAHFVLVGDGPQAPEVARSLAAHGVACDTTA